MKQREKKEGRKEGQKGKHCKETYFYFFVEVYNVFFKPQLSSTCQTNVLDSYTKCFTSKKWGYKQTK